MHRAWFALLFFHSAGGCGSSDAGTSASPDGGIDLNGDSSFVDAALPDGDKPRTDGGFVGPDGSVYREDRFVTKVVSFLPGECAGFGVPDMPDIVMGPPVGAGALAGSFDVASLGLGGEIVLSVEPNAIVDGPGADFIVFENAFFASGNPNQPAADPGEVSVSEDGVTWKTFACTPPDAGSGSTDYGTCAGWHPVYSAPDNGISPFDVAKAGGEAYDLSAVGLAKAKFIRIKDRSTSTCAGIMPKPNNAGFDLDAIAVVNAENP
jgi:hypothetical protein